MTTQRDRTQRKALRKIRIAGFVACFLLAAQVFALCHALDFRGHANHEPCKICVSMAGFVAGANVGNALTIPVVPRAAEPVTAYTVLFVTPAAVPQGARGPPLAS